MPKTVYAFNHDNYLRWRDWVLANDRPSHRSAGEINELLGTVLNSLSAWSKHQGDWEEPKLEAHRSAAANALLKLGYDWYNLYAYKVLETVETATRSER
jgi:hypothetical protein